jgi:hypothetical protein
MAVVCRELGLLFIMTPRTACTAIGDLLLTHYGGEYLPSDDIYYPDGRIRIQKKHSTLPDLIRGGILTAEEARGLLKCATVRNPFDSLVSLYLKQRSKYQPLLKDPTSWVNRSPAYAANMRYASTHSFKQWVFRKCRKQLLKRVLGVPPSMFADYTHRTDVVMRYENIAQELDALLRKVGVPIAEQLPVVNRTEERNSAAYRAWYSRESVTAVRLAFSQDFQRYGYRF